MLTLPACFHPPFPLPPFPTLTGASNPTKVPTGNFPLLGRKIIRHFVSSKFRFEITVYCGIATSAVEFLLTCHVYCTVLCDCVCACGYRRYYLNSHHIDIHCWSMDGKGKPLKVTASGATGVAHSDEFKCTFSKLDLVLSIANFKWMVALLSI